MKPPFELRPIEEGMEGKVTIVTGGTSGIGKACVKAFCYAGCKVVTVGRNADVGTALAKELTEKGPGICEFYKCDVSKEQELKDLVDFTVKKFGHIDVLVNNAGYFPEQRPIDEVTVQEFNDILATNLVAYYALSRFVMPYLRTVKGNIVNIGSAVGTLGDEGAAIYCATKGAIESMTKSLAIDEARNGVRVNEVKPGNINTEMYDRIVSEQPDPAAFAAYEDSVQWLGHGGSPQEAATAVLFLASEWASFITGTSLMVTGGYEFGEGTKVPKFHWTTMEKK